MEVRIQKDVIDKFMQMITRMRDSEDEAGRMNHMLAPELHACHAEQMTADIRFEAQDWERNMRGELHGGSIASMFDLSMGMSVLAFSEHRQVSTADLSVSYIRPFLGQSFLFHVEVIHLGRKLARVRAIAGDENTGKTLASATANFVYLA